jgi:ubiquinol-cytochrome c reductase subunit 6
MAEEAELVDPKETLTEKCREDSHCAHYKEELEKCSDRVNSRSSTTETCAQELYDFIHCVDHCVSKTLFNHLK